MTHCCQHYYGPGETAMLYGLYYGGFAVYEEKGIVKAQAECWIDSKTKALVLDNIELANGAPISKVEGSLKEWVEALPYELIVMGTGYADVMPSWGHKTLDCWVQPDDPHAYTDTIQGLCVLKGQRPKKVATFHALADEDWDWPHWIEEDDEPFGGQTDAQPNGFEPDNGSADEEVDEELGDLDELGDDDEDFMPDPIPF